MLGLLGLRTRAVRRGILSNGDGLLGWLPFLERTTRLFDPRQGSRLRNDTSGSGGKPSRGWKMIEKPLLLSNIHEHAYR